MRRRVWIVFCNAVIIALALMGIYKDTTFGREYGLIPPGWVTVASQHLANEVLAALLLLGIVAELRSWRHRVVINCVAYSGIALATIWTGLSLLGDPAFVPNLFESVPLFLVSGFNLWLFLWSSERHVTN